MRQFEGKQRSYARASGWLLVAMLFTGITAEFVARMGLYVEGDVTATITNMLASPGRYTLGLLAYLGTFLLDVFVAVYLYRLFEAQDKTKSLLALGFRLVYTAIIVSFLMFYVAAGLFIYSDLIASWQTDAHVHQQAYLMMHLFGEGFLFALIVFGFHLVYLGLLVMQSEVLSRWLGILVVLGGLSYSMNGLLHYTLPDLQGMLAPLFGLLGMAEILLAVFLIIKSRRLSQST